MNHEKINMNNLFIPSFFNYELCILNYELSYSDTFTPTLNTRCRG